LIRPYREEDLRQVEAIEVSSFSDPWPSSFFTYLQDKSPDLFLVALEGEGVIGYIIGKLREMMMNGVPHILKIGHIVNIVVDEKLRRRGIGSNLINEIECKFKEHGAGQMVLEVRESNAPALSFYKSHGFSEIGKVKAYYQDENAVIMSKYL
jgi:ribosomal-protein-alanine N-acetyltransferase